MVWRPAEKLCVAISGNSLGLESGETSNIGVVYLFEFADATGGPEYRTTTVEAGGSKTADSFLLFGMATEF